VGYVNFFPLLLGLVNSNSSRLVDMLNVLGPQNINGTWSKYGLRSLAASDPLFGSNENYWRGPIWININFMLLKTLKHIIDRNETIVFEQIHQQVTEIYTKLRQNLVVNIYQEYKKLDTFGSSIMHLLAKASVQGHLMVGLH